jgi:hypothetical protein
MISGNLLAKDALNLKLTCKKINKDIELTQPIFDKHICHIIKIIENVPTSEYRDYLKVTTDNIHKLDSMSSLSVLILLDCLYNYNYKIDFIMKVETFYTLVRWIIEEEWLRKLTIENILYGNYISIEQKSRFVKLSEMINNVLLTHLQ